MQDINRRRQRVATHHAGPGIRYFKCVCIARRDLESSRMNCCYCLRFGYRLYYLHFIQTCRRRFQKSTHDKSAGRSKSWNREKRKNQSTPPLIVTRTSELSRRSHSGPLSLRTSSLQTTTRPNTTIRTQRCTNNRKKERLVT